MKTQKFYNKQQATEASAALSLFWEDGWGKITGPFTDDKNKQYYEVTAPDTKANTSVAEARMAAKYWGRMVQSQTHNPNTPAGQYELSMLSFYRTIILTKGRRRATA